MNSLTKRILLPGLMLLLFLASTQTGLANEESKGFRAQAQGRWEEAATAYRQTLANEPHRADIWLRLAEVQLQLDRKEQALDSLEHATETARDDQAVLLDLAKAYGAQEQPEEALEALERLTELEPERVDYWIMHAQFANWAGKPGLAARSYERAWALDLDNLEAAHGMAQALSWTGDYGEAIPAYRRYLEVFPDDEAGWMELGWLLYWSGKNQETLETLNSYRDRFGNTPQVMGLQARILAVGGRPAQALELGGDLMAQEPENFETQVTRLLALLAHREPEAALAAAEEMESRFSDREQTDPITKYVRVPLQHHLDGGIHYYGDTDDIQIFGADAAVTFVDEPGTRFGFGYELERLWAKSDTGLEREDGGTRIDDTRFWGYMRHRFDHWIAMDGRLGGGKIESGSTYTHYFLGADLDPVDPLHLRLEGGKELYAVSPRAVSAEVFRKYGLLQGEITPDLRHTIVFETSISDFSDGNDQWEILVVPRRAVVRKPGFLLDVGVSGQWLSFSENLDNGYYDPSFFQRYALIGYFYWLLSENDTVGLVLDAGMHEDDDTSGFRFGDNVSAQATFGIYKEWMLHLKAGYLERYNDDETFRAWSALAQLTYRF